jgi:hypothetical protein
MRLLACLVGPFEILYNLLQIPIVAVLLDRASLLVPPLPIEPQASLQPRRLPPVGLITEYIG